ncbi:MAG: hypothetical protein ACFFAN_00220 [Promethearchaeota archaeon]
MSENRLESLPSSIKNLESLLVLWLQENQLTTLLESIENLRSLIKIDVCDNPNLTSKSIKMLERMSDNAIKV